jgi:threonyl-tRNA synthetase
LIRHDCAHVLAEAVQDLFPGTQVTIGPVIENGFYYDFARPQPFTPEDFSAIEARMREIVARDKPFTKEVWSRDEARRVFAGKGEAFKVELVDAIPEGQDLKIYRQGDWFDLCRGPHMTSTGKVGTAFKLMKVAGAYWRGDHRNPQLTRIYGTAWATQAELDAYLHRLEEAERRDHRRLGREMDLFHFQEDAPGTVFWHPHGWTLFQTLVAYVRRVQAAAGYQEVNAPQLLERSLWETSGHWEKYHENMFVTETEDERVFALKPMNCPGHVQIFKHGLKSYRDLPMKLAEFGAVHRYEPSGALHGLLRCAPSPRTTPHVFITEEMIREESLKINDLILSIYRDFGFEEVLVKLSTRPAERVGADALWDKANPPWPRSWPSSSGTGWRPDHHRASRRGRGLLRPEVRVHLEGRDRTAVAGRHQPRSTSTCRAASAPSTSVPDGRSGRPVMLHRAMLGSLERFIGIIIENYAGHFPLWLAPLQIVVCTITSDADGYAADVASAARRAGLRVETDLRNEKITYKVREHSVAKVPALLVIGRKEAAERTVSIRRLGSPEQRSMGLDAALRVLAEEAVPPDLRREGALAQAAE